MRLLFLASVAMTVSACSGASDRSVTSHAPPPIEWNLRSSKISQKDAERALAIFKAACPKLGSGAGDDIKEIRVTTQDEYADHRLARGWKTNFEVGFSLKDDLKTLPSLIRDLPPLSGNTLSFNLGGGQTPGFMAGKRAAQALRGMPPGDGADTFKAAPQLSFLDPIA